MRAWSWLATALDRARRDKFHFVWVSMVTDWYPADVKPVRNGWYEVKIKGRIHRKYFIEGEWLNMDKPYPWRGLKSIPRGEGR